MSYKTYGERNADVKSNELKQKLKNLICCI